MKLNLKIYINSEKKNLRSANDCYCVILVVVDRQRWRSNNYIDCPVLGVSLSPLKILPKNLSLSLC